MKRLWNSLNLFLCVGFLLMPNMALSAAESVSLVGVWNGFQEQTNVIECSNPSKKKLVGTLRLTNSARSTLAEVPLRIPGKGTIHFPLNDYAIQNDYGLFEIVVQSGRKPFCFTSYYRLSARAEAEKQVEYAYALPAGRALRGTVSGTYNSMNPEGSTSPVFNWLSVYNLSDKAMSIDLEVYRQDGSLDQGQSRTLNRLRVGERRDIALGHEVGQQVGLYRLVPRNSTQAYGSFLSRFSLKEAGRYNFSFPLIPSSGSCDSGPIPASTMGGAQNWLEIANASDHAGEVVIDLRRRDGTQLFNGMKKLAARSQVHINANSYLGEGSIGWFRVRCKNLNKPIAILAQSIFYGFDSRQPQQINWAYASQSNPYAANEKIFISAYNTFLSAANWLKLLNPNISSGATEVGLYDAHGTNLQKDLSRQARSGALDYDVHTQVGANTFGYVSTTVEKGNYPNAELIRVYPSTTGDVGYIMNVPSFPARLVNGEVRWIEVDDEEGGEATPGEGGSPSENTRPSAVSASLSTTLNKAKNITLLANDPDGDRLTWRIVSAPQHGNLSGSAPKLRYTPQAGYHGDDSFTFRVHDGRLTSNVATIRVLISSEFSTEQAQYFVDSKLSEDCLANNYSVKNRNCSGGNGTAFQTLQAAANVVQPGDVVLIRGGVYRNTGVDDNRGRITARMKTSGTREKPIYFANFPGEQPILDGAEPLTNWQPCSSQGDCAGATGWQHMFRSQQSSDVTANMLFLQEGDFDHLEQLLVAQDPTPEKDSPDFDWQFFTATKGYWHKTVSGNLGTTWIVDASLFGPSSADLVGAFLHLNTCNNNVIERKILSHDKAAGRIEFESIGGDNCLEPGKDSFMLRNHPSFIDTPGEYYVDETTDTIYLWPFDPAKLSTVRGAVRHKGIDLRGQDNIVIQGLRFVGFSTTSSEPSSDGGIVNYNFGSSYSVTGITVRNNVFHDLKGSAVVIGGGSDVLIENNTVLRTSIGRALHLSGGTNNRIVGNSVIRGGRSPLVFFGVKGGLISKNTIIDCLGEHSNAITTYLECEDIEISHNYVRNSQLSWALQSSRGLHAHHNVFIVAGGAAIAGWGGAFKDGNAGDVLIERNTIFSEDRDFLASVAVNETYENVEIRNNILDSGVGRNHHHNLYLTPRESDLASFHESVELDWSRIFVNEPGEDLRLLGGTIGSPPVNVCTMASDGSYVGAKDCVRCVGSQPLALFSASQSSGLENLRVRFDASRARGCGGASRPEIRNYRWEFGDGAVATGTHAESVEHSYSRGTWVVRLTVTDSYGRSASATKTITALPAVEPNLLLHYSFEDDVPSDKIAIDRAGKERNGNWFNSSGEAIDGVYGEGREGGSAAVFGSGNSIKVPNDPALRGMNEVTFSIWVKKESPESKGMIFYKPGHYSMQDDSKNLVFSLILESGAVGVSTSKVNDTQWHHFAMTYDGSFFRAYVDGSMVGQAEGSGPTKNVNFNSWGHRVGATSGGGSAFGGRFDDYRIFDRGLSTEQILILADR